MHTPMRHVQHKRVFLAHSRVHALPLRSPAPAPLNRPRNRWHPQSPPPCPCVPLQSLMGDANDTVRRLASFGVGASLAFLEPEVQSGILENLVRGRAPSGGAGGAGAGAGASGDWTVVHGVRLALYGAVRCVPSPLPVVHGLVCVWIAGPLALFTPRGPSLLLLPVLSSPFALMIVCCTFRFSPSVMAPHLGVVADIALADSGSDTVPLRQVAAGLVGTLLVEITVRCGVWGGQRGRWWLSRRADRCAL
jgi:hypothetical protein